MFSLKLETPGSERSRLYFEKSMLYEITIITNAMHHMELRKANYNYHECDASYGVTQGKLSTLVSKPMHLLALSSVYGKVFFHSYDTKKSYEKLQF